MNRISKFMLIAVGILLGNLGFSQSYVCYTYDNTGNRTNQDWCVIITLDEDTGDETALNAEKAIDVEAENGDFKRGAQVDLFPNPVERMLNVVIDNDGKKVSVECYDNTGGLINTWNNIYTGGQIDVSSIKAGVYIFKVYGDGVDDSFRIVIL